LAHNLICSSTSGSSQYQDDGIITGVGIIIFIGVDIIIVVGVGIIVLIGVGELTRDYSPDLPWEVRPFHGTLPVFLFRNPAAAYRFRVNFS
jgi:hypothetical protein